MSIRRHTLYNMAGGLASILIPLITVPLYIERIGLAKYGVLLIVWLLLGYFSFFDLGLGRATGYAVAQEGSGPTHRARIIWSALAVNLLVGIAGGILVWTSGSLILGFIVHSSATLYDEAQSALPWIAVAIPLATGGSVIQGALQGTKKFLALNIFSFFGSLFFRVIPLLVAYFLNRPGF